MLSQVHRGNLHTKLDMQLYPYHWDFWCFLIKSTLLPRVDNFGSSDIHFSRSVLLGLDLFQLNQVEFWEGQWQTWTILICFSALFLSIMNTIPLYEHTIHYSTNGYTCFQNWNIISKVGMNGFHKSDDQIIFIFDSNIRRIETSKLTTN